MKVSPFILLLLLLNSCSINNKRKETISPQIIFENEVNLELKKHIDITKLIALEENDESFFSSVNQLIVTEDFYFILDKRPNSIIVFNKEGGFVKKIGKLGQGPREYSFVTSISCDKINRKLYLVSDEKILSYNLDSLTYIEENLVTLGVSVEPLPEEYFAAFNFMEFSYKNSNIDSHILIVDSCFNIYSSFLGIPFQSGYIMSPRNRFYRYNDQLYAFPPFDNTIYKVDKDSCCTHYSIGYGKYSLPPIEFLNSHKEGNYIVDLYKTDYVRHAVPFENNSHLIMLYSVGENRHLGVYDKSKNQAYYFKANQAESSVNPLYNICGVQDDTFIAYTTEENIQNTFDIANSEQHKEMLLKSKVGSDTPILFFFKFKNRD